MHGRLSLPTITNEGQDSDLRSISFILLRNIRVIIGMAGVIFLLTIFVLLTITPKYTATAQILLDPRKQNVIGAEAMFADLPFDQTAVDNQIALIQSPVLLSRVVESEKLIKDDEFGAAASRSLLSRLFSMFRSSPENPPSADEAPSAAEDAAKRDELGRITIRSISALQSGLAVDRVGRTHILSIKATSRIPAKAARLANAIANAYITDQLEARYDSARRASVWLGERLEKLREELRNSETAVAHFRAENSLGAAVTGAVSEAQMGDLNAKLAAARAETAEKRAKFEQSQRILNQGGNLQSIPDLGQSLVMSTLKNQQVDISRREADLIARYGDHHPALVNVRAERQDVERQIRMEMARTIANLKNEYDIARTRQGSLEASLGVVTGQGGSDNAIAVRLRELERVAAANKALYESFLSRFKLSEEQANLAVRDARIISVARIPGAPSFPRTTLISALALVFGLGAGVGTAFLLEGLRRGFTTPGEVEKMLELPALSSVPFLTAKDLISDGKPMSPAFFILNKPLSRFSEAIRSARSGIQMSNVDEPPKLIQVTSSVAGEGKTTVAISLAQSAATSFKRVLLIDCDLRRPALSATFGLKKRQGVVDLLVGSATGDQVIVRDPATGLFLLGAGSSTQNPPDMLSSARMRALLAQLRESYDYIVLDSPPLGPVIDAVVLSQLVDKVVYVVHWNQTPRDLVARGLKQFQPENKIAGVILNCVDTKQSTLYGGYYYSKYNEKYYAN